MGIVVEKIQEDLLDQADQEKAEFLPKFFQAVPGGYAEGDEFIGVTVPNQRKVAKKYYREITLDELEHLLQATIHEFRLTALFILVLKFEKAECDTEREGIVSFYIDNISCVNNWDLVDSSAFKILGAYLFDKPRTLLYKFADSGDLWKQRIAIISTFYFIKQHDFQDTLNLAEKLLQHDHDLIHKAVGWMLREVGKRDFKKEYEFLKIHYQKMPRTMLRYAIEKFDEDLRKQFLKGQI